MKILITGAAGFIGSHLSRELVTTGNECTFVDRLSNYYSADYKRLRFNKLVGGDLHEIDLAKNDLTEILGDRRYDVIVHLAAQPGVRVPYPENLNYYQDNLEAFSKVARYAVTSGVSKFFYASSSSVYEKASIYPFQENESLGSPSGLYPFTKWLNEKIASSMETISNTKFYGLRFFSVYGPWGRPDMAYLRLIAASQGHYNFKLNGDGTIKRDYTFIEDVIERLSYFIVNDVQIPFVLNIGGGNSISINDLVSQVQKTTKTSINIDTAPTVKSELPKTLCDKKLLSEFYDEPFTLFETGINTTIEWYLTIAQQQETQKWFL